MNEDIKQEWLAALRSGEYRQAHEQLRNGDRFCCLGVLCDLHSKATGAGKWVDDRYYPDNEPPWIDTLPEAVIEWAGLIDTSPSVDDDEGHQYPLAAFNDGLESDELRPHTFEEIAALIEAQL